MRRYRSYTQPLGQVFAAARVCCEGMPWYVKSTMEFISSSVQVLRVTAVDTSRYCAISPQYCRSTTEFISNSVHVLRGTAAVQVGTAQFSRSKNLCRYARCVRTPNAPPTHGPTVARLLVITPRRQILNLALNLVCRSRCLSFDYEQYF